MLTPHFHPNPPNPNNFTNHEILACALHRMRAQHNVEPPSNLYLYQGPRESYQEEHETVSVEGNEEYVDAFALYDTIGTGAALIILRPDCWEAEAYYKDIESKFKSLNKNMTKKRCNIWT